MASGPLWEQYKDQLDALGDAHVNFDPDRSEEYRKDASWHFDEYEVELLSEPPGPPVKDGPWEMGQQVMRDYRFPDPKIITGIYYPESPLAERVMLLRARFMFFTFYFGVKIGGVTDERRETEAGPAQIWGYNYQTLQGHFEKGQMNFAIWKYLDSGRVFFRIHAFSQQDRIPNLLYRAGFKVLGRPLQRYFAHQALKRMKRFVAEDVAAARSGKRKQKKEEGPAVQPAGAERESREQMEKAQAQAAEAPDTE
ncbi:MAG: DUF1990 family protein [Anaerolineales bacterium]|nr:DUF1990 family protein [Anaerolineales bacterium]